jgi:hypothetical protein
MRIGCILASCILAPVTGIATAKADSNVIGEPATGSAIAADDSRLAGDYFVGAAIFLFQRTVLTVFAPEKTPDSLLDAGAVVWAVETAHDEAGAVALDAITAWLTAADLKLPVSGGKERPPVFTPDRLHDLACLAYGGNPGNEGELAAHGELSAEERERCIAQFKQAQAQWDGWLRANRRQPQQAPADAARLQLRFAPTADEADQAIADAMLQNGLFQALTDGINDDLAMPRPVTALLTQCGEPRAFYNPDRGEAVLCYETLGALLLAAPR